MSSRMFMRARREDTVDKYICAMYTDVRLRVMYANIIYFCVKEPVDSRRETNVS